jgi:hypothetical protein
MFDKIQYKIYQSPSAKEKDKRALLIYKNFSRLKKINKLFSRIIKK